MDFRRVFDFGENCPGGRGACCGGGVELGDQRPVREEDGGDADVPRPGEPRAPPSVVAEEGPCPGGVVSVGGAFDTVTVTAPDVVEFPAASRALAVRECDPLATVVVFHDAE